MSIPAAQVSVRPSIVDRSGTHYSGRKPFIVKWKVAGRDHSKAWSTQREADRFRSQLVAAKADGHRFDAKTGRPIDEDASALPTPAADVRFVDHASAFVQKKWGTLKGNSRKGLVEGLTIACYTLTDEQPPPALLKPMRDYIGAVVLNPPALELALEPSASGRRCRDWLAEHSLPVTAIRARHIEASLSVMNQRLDGSGAVASTTLMRRRNALHACMKAAARDELVAANPVPLVDRKSISTQSGPRAVEREAIPSLAQGLELVELIATYGREGARHAPFFLCILLAGLRPSEVAFLHDVDLDLLDSGWGTVKVWGGTVVPGRRYTETDRQWEDEDQKWRPSGSPARQVPIPPRLVTALREHIAHYGTSEEGRLFVNTHTNPLSSANTGKAWRWARAQLWPARRDARGVLLDRRFQHPFYNVRPYALRHTNASTLIGRMPDAEVARRLGHSVDVLRRIYAGWFQDDARDGNAAMDQAFGDLLGA